MDSCSYVVFTNAKILILKLITTNCSLIKELLGCIYQCKDTNFKANHNRLFRCFVLFCVVFTNAKILILKLITTVYSPPCVLISCIYQCKDTNFKANHNLNGALCIGQYVVFTNAKILILKLITTGDSFCTVRRKLYLPMQRY